MPSVGRAAEFFYETELRLVYTPDDYDETRVMHVDVNLDGQDDLEFQIVNQEGNNHLAGLDSTRNGGFLTEFDNNDYGVFMTFAKDQAIGPGFEDAIGYETLTHAAYEYDEFGNLVVGGSLAQTQAYLGFAFYTDQVEHPAEEGTIYGWMLVSFGELIADDPGDPEKVFIEVMQIGYNNTVGQPAVVGRVPEPASVALLGAGAALLLRRRGRRAWSGSGRPALPRRG